MRFAYLTALVCCLGLSDLFGQSQNTDTSGLNERWPNSVGVLPIRILTWNVYMRPAGLFWNGQFRRAEVIGEILKDEAYDILLLQEAFGKCSRRKLRNALKGKYPYEVEPQRHKAMTNSGLWILSRYPILHSQTVFFDDCLVGDCHSSKGAVLIEVGIDGQRYQFLNTHTQAEDGPKFAEVRKKQFQMIRRLLDRHRKDETPQFVLGDLNTDLHAEDEYDNMLQTLDATNGPVSVLEANVLSTGHAITWGCANNDLIPRKWKARTYLLDHALERKSNYRFKIRRELKTYTRKWSRKRKHLSDHYGISLTILP